MRSRQTTLWLLCIGASDAFLWPSKLDLNRGCLHAAERKDDKYDISKAHFVKQSLPQQVPLEPNLDNDVVNEPPTASRPSDVLSSSNDGNADFSSNKFQATPAKKYKQVRTFSGGYQLVEDISGPMPLPVPPTQHKSTPTRSWRAGAFSTSVNLNPGGSTTGNSRQSIPPLSDFPVQETQPKQTEFGNPWRTKTFSSSTSQNKLKTLGDEPFDKSAALGMEVPVSAKKSTTKNGSNSRSTTGRPVPLGDQPLDKSAAKGMEIPISAKLHNANVNSNIMSNRVTPIGDPKQPLDKNAIQGLQVPIQANHATQTRAPVKALSVELTLPNMSSATPDQPRKQSIQENNSFNETKPSLSSLQRSTVDPKGDPKHSLGRSAIEGLEVPIKAPKFNGSPTLATSPQSNVLPNRPAQQILSPAAKTPTIAEIIDSKNNQTPLLEPHLHVNALAQTTYQENLALHESDLNSNNASSLLLPLENSNLTNVPKFQQIETAAGFKMVDYVEFMDDMRPKFRTTRVDYPETWIRPVLEKQTNIGSDLTPESSGTDDEAFTGGILSNQRTQETRRLDGNRTKIAGDTPKNDVSTATITTTTQNDSSPKPSRPKIKQVRTAAGFQLVVVDEDDLSERVVRRVDYPETWKKDSLSKSTSVKVLQIQTDAGFEMIEASDDLVLQNKSYPVGMKRADYPETWQKPLSKNSIPNDHPGKTDNKATKGTSVPISAPSKPVDVPKKYKKVKTFSGGFQFVEDDGNEEPIPVKVKPTNLKVKQVQTPAGFQMVTVNGEKEPEQLDTVPPVIRADYPETWQKAAATTDVNQGSGNNPAAEGLSVTVRAPNSVSGSPEDVKDMQVKPDQLIDLGAKALQGTFLNISNRSLSQNQTKEIMTTTESNPVNNDLGGVRADFPETWRKSTSATVPSPELNGPHRNSATIGTSVTVKAPGSLQHNFRKQTPMPDQESPLGPKASNGTFVAVAAAMESGKPTNIQRKTAMSSTTNEVQNLSDGVRADFPQTWRRSLNARSTGQSLTGPHKNSATAGTFVTVRAPVHYVSGSQDAQKYTEQPDQSVPLSSKAIEGTFVDVAAHSLSGSVNAGPTASKAKFSVQPDQSAPLGARALQGTFVDVLASRSMTAGTNFPKKIPQPPDQSVPLSSRALEGTFVDVAARPMSGPTVAVSTSSKAKFSVQPDQSAPIGARALAGTYVDVVLSSSSMTSRKKSPNEIQQPDQSVPLSSRALEGTFVDVSAYSANSGSTPSKAKFSVQPDQSAPLGARALAGTFVNVSPYFIRRSIRGLTVESTLTSSGTLEGADVSVSPTSVPRHASEDLSTHVESQKDAELSKQTKREPEDEVRPLHWNDDLGAPKESTFNGDEKANESRTQFSLKIDETSSHFKSQDEPQQGEQAKRQDKKDTYPELEVDTRFTDVARSKVEDETARPQTEKDTRVPEMATRNAEVEVVPTSQHKKDQAGRPTQGVRHEAEEAAARFKSYEETRLAPEPRHNGVEAVRVTGKQEAGISDIAESKTEIEAARLTINEKTRLSEFVKQNFDGGATQLSQELKSTSEENADHPNRNDETRPPQEALLKVVEAVQLKKDEEVRRGEVTWRNTEDAARVQNDDTARQFQEARITAGEDVVAEAFIVIKTEPIADASRHKTEDVAQGEATSKSKEDERRWAELSRHNTEDAVWVQNDEAVRLPHEAREHSSDEVLLSQEKRNKEAEDLLLKNEKNAQPAEPARPKADDGISSRKADEGVVPAPVALRNFEHEATLLQREAQAPLLVANKVKDDPEAARLAEEAIRSSKEEVTRLKKDDEARLAQEVRHRTEEDARRQREEKAIQLSEVARRKGKEEAARKIQVARRKAQEATLLKRDEDTRQKAVEAVRLKREEEARRAKVVRDKAEEAARVQKEKASLPPQESMRKTQEEVRKAQEAQRHASELLQLKKEASRKAEEAAWVKIQEVTRLSQEVERTTAEQAAQQKISLETKSTAAEVLLLPKEEESRLGEVAICNINATARLAQEVESKVDAELIPGKIDEGAQEPQSTSDDPVRNNMYDDEGMMRDAKVEVEKETRIAQSVQSLDDKEAFQYKVKKEINHQKQRSEEFNVNFGQEGIEKKNRTVDDANVETSTGKKWTSNSYTSKKIMAIPEESQSVAKRKSFTTSNFQSDPMPPRVDTFGLAGAKPVRSTSHSHLSAKAFTQQPTAKSDILTLISPPATKKVWKQVPTPGGFKLIQVVEQPTAKTSEAVVIAVNSTLQDDDGATIADNLEIFAYENKTMEDLAESDVRLPIVVKKVEFVGKVDDSTSEAVITSLNSTIQEHNSTNTTAEVETKQRRRQEEERESRHENAKAAVARIKEFFDKKSSTDDAIVDQWLNYEKSWNALPSAAAALNQTEKDLIKKRATYYFARNIEPNRKSELDSYVESDKAKQQQQPLPTKIPLQKGTPFFAQKAAPTTKESSSEA